MRRTGLILLSAVALLTACTADRNVVRPGFTVSLSGSSFYVDEPVEFRFEGDADIVSFWSGESGNDFRWKDEERIYEGEGVLSFGTAFMNGAQWKNQASDDSDTKLLTFWWSDDFDGDYTPEGIKRAVWHDATSLFTFASERVDDARLLSSATPSGAVSLSDMIPSGSSGPFWFAFRYHLLENTDPSTLSRSRAVVSGFTINCVNEALHVNEAVVTNSSAGWTFVNEGYDASDENYMPEASASYIWFNSSTANTAERKSWAVSQAYRPDYSVNLGCDHALGIKSFSDARMGSYTYSYSAPGDYDAVFVSRNVSEDGTVAEKEQHISVHVSERGSAIIDDPGQKEWKVVRFRTGASTRAAFSQDLSALSWENGDGVGIYAVNASGTVGLNYPYGVENPDGASATLSAVSSQWQYSRSDASGSTFYAYSPFTGTAGEGNAHVVPVSVPSVQVQETAGSLSHLSSYMILKAFPASANAETGEVNLRFRNLTALVEIELKASSSSSFKISSAVLKAEAPLSFDRGNMALAASPSDDGTAFQINEAQDSVALSLTEPFSFGTEGSKLYFTVIPGSHTAGSIRLRLLTTDGYAAEALIPEGVIFEGNGVYRKTVTLSPSDFKPSSGGGASYVWKKIVSASDIAEGDYVIGYDYSYDGTSGSFLLPCTPVDRNPIPAPADALGLHFGSGGELLDAPEGFVWTLSEVSGGWNIHFSDSGTGYYLSGCDSAQGIAISSDGKGYYSSSKTYSSVWTFSESGSGLQLSVPVSTRRAMPWYDPSSGLDHFEWRMTKSDTGGYVLYHKTIAE